MRTSQRAPAWDGQSRRKPLGNCSASASSAMPGIAKPEAFFDALEREGLRLVTTLAFPDHSGYGEEEIAAVLRLKEASRSEYLITTEKDAVKLKPHLEKLGNVFAAGLELRFEDSRLLENTLEKLL